MPPTTPTSARPPATARRPIARPGILAAALVALAALILGAVPAAAVDDPGTSRPFPAPVGSCFTTPTPKALAPNQLAAAYGLTPLWDAGHAGQGIRMAVLDPGELPDLTEVEKFRTCQGITAPVHVETIGTGTEPTVQGEASLDLIVALTAAPKLDGLYLFSSRSDVQFPLVSLLEAAVDPARTGGQRVDVISVSFGGCEAKENTDNPGYLAAMEAALQKVAEAGVSVFLAGGDSGSAACAPHPVLETNPDVGVAAVGYPGSSPWVVNVGGTQIDWERDAAGAGRVTAEIVWNESDPGPDTARFAGGGGHSRFFAMPEWQKRFGLPGTMRSTPDVTGLAGSPFYGSGNDDGYWFGTSAASPYTAGGWAVVLSALKAKGVPNPGFLAPLLYTLAAKDGAKVYRDITIGDNDPWGQVGCCAAGVGYDNASGLGSLRFDALATALGAPTASLVATPASATVATPTTAVAVTLDAAGSTTPGGSITAYEWDDDGDGTVDVTTTTPRREITTTGAGSTTASVTIRTDLGRSARATASVTVTLAATPVVAVVVTPTFTG